jgi:hypothetical protein
MNIADCMKRNVVSVPATATILEAAAIFVKNHLTETTSSSAID